MISINGTNPSAIQTSISTETNIKPVAIKNEQSLNTEKLGSEVKIAEQKQQSSSVTQPQDLDKPNTSIIQTGINGLQSISATMAELQLLLGSLKGVQDGLKQSLGDIQSNIQTDGLKGIAKELNVSANWQMAFSIISGALSLGCTVLDGVSSYKDMMAAKQETAFNTTLEQQNEQITNKTNELNNSALTTEQKAALQTELDELTLQHEQTIQAFDAFKQGETTRKTWMEFAFNVMQGANSFIDNNLLAHSQPPVADKNESSKGISNSIQDILDKSNNLISNIEENIKQPQLEMQARTLA